MKSFQASPRLHLCGLGILLRSPSILRESSWASQRSVSSNNSLREMRCIFPLLFPRTNTSAARIHLNDILVLSDLEASLLLWSFSGCFLFVDDSTYLSWRVNLGLVQGLKFVPSHLTNTTVFFRNSGIPERRTDMLSSVFTSTSLLICQGVTLCSHCPISSHNSKKAWLFMD